MKALFLFFIFAINIILLGNIRVYAQDTPTLFLTLLQKEDYREAYAMQDEKMKTLLPQDTLQKMWEDMQKDLGKLLTFHTITTAEKDGYTVVTIHCQFEKNVLIAQVALDREGKIAGLYFFPAPLREYSPPPYAQREQFTEYETTFGLPGWELPGTITIPQGVGPFPALLLVHGSGPNDRDETVLAHKPFKDLAWGLATKGIAVFRYDKRTYVYGLKISTSEDITRFTVETEVI
ncbi:MAG: alpha/beta hydrolase, partial [Candidatus Caldatribacteriaceae bacterium]